MSDVCLEWEQILSDSVMEYARSGLGRVLETTESPIERVMLLALLRQFGTFPSCGLTLSIPGSGISEGRYPVAVYDSVRFGRAAIVPQARVEAGGKRYRLDLALILRRDGTVVRRVAIECDGHDFHERTKAPTRLAHEVLEFMQEGRT
jgi:hypothetical protein